MLQHLNGASDLFLVGAVPCAPWKCLVFPLFQVHVKDWVCVGQVSCLWGGTAWGQGSVSPIYLTGSEPSLSSPVLLQPGVFACQGD